MRAGYGVLAMVLFRILWGFAGTRHARFASFVHGPRTAIRYARSFARRAPQATVGHNPLGGWSVIALLLALLVQAGTGLFANDDVLMEGPSGQVHQRGLSDRITDHLHHLNVWVIGILVGTHVAAVVSHWPSPRRTSSGRWSPGRKHLHRVAGEPRASTRCRTFAPLSLLAASDPVGLVAGRPGSDGCAGIDPGALRAPILRRTDEEEPGRQGPALPLPGGAATTCCGNCRGSCRSSWSRASNAALTGPCCRPARRRRASASPPSNASAACWNSAALLQISGCAWFGAP